MTQKAESISSASFATTIISVPRTETPVEIDSDLDFELLYHPRSYAKSSSSDASSSDSSLGSSFQTVHTSLKSFVTAYQFEHGRRYHAFRPGCYLLPNDAPEQARMELGHDVWRVVMGGSLCCDRVRENVLEKSKGRSRCLDLGTGTGIWAIDFADEWSGSGVVVVGNDLSPIQPRWVPPNCSFVVDDFETIWSYHTSEAFDYVHARNLAGSVSSWSAVLANVYAHLLPNGWFELQECEISVYSDIDPGLDRAPLTREWQTLLMTGMRIFGKSLDVVAEMEDYLKTAKFVDVRRETFEVPIGTWSDDEALKEIGRFQQEIVVDGVEAHTLAVFTRVLEWTHSDTKKFIKKVKAELRSSQDVRLYSRYHVIYGRKAG